MSLMRLLSLALLFLLPAPAAISWKGQNYWRVQLLAQQGCIFACLDNRVTGGRGGAFKKTTRFPDEKPRGKMLPLAAN